MSEPFETAVAGSRSFALALFAPLTERAGTRPRIATDVAQAGTLVAGAGLVVVELQSPAWLAAVQKLSAERPSLRFVVALPKGAEAAIAPLQAIGVEALPWTDAASLLPAIDRALGRAAAAPVAPVDVAPPPPPAARQVAKPAPPPPAPRPPAAPPPAKPPAALAPPLPEKAAAPPPAAPRVAANALFDDLDEHDFDVDLEEAPASSDPFADPFAAASAQVDAAVVPSPGAVWPATAPDLATAERALLAAIDGAAPPVPSIAAVAAQVAGALSPLERAALSGAELEVDAEPLRRSAAMRVRVGVAFATAPPPGSPSDSVAVATLLAEIDALLGEVNGLAANASADLAPALGACRNALVKEAIDFSEAAQRYVPVEVTATAEAAAPRPRAPGVRVLSDGKVTEGERRQAKRSRSMVTVLAVVVVLTAAYHAWAFFESRRPIEEPSTLPGMPGHTMGTELRDGNRTLAAKPGQTLDEETIRRFRDDEQLKGRVVIELGQGNLISVEAPSGIESHDHP